ncbi:hypothetical protein EDF54_2158 [Rathayibacter sp. PhB93]|nr:hypothetical protein EDF54_2158 [Rathayibacter sp. PhB93]TDQ12390.1 hypothetical protein EDF17_2249 [Rathayibacter sp. PhB1]
MNGSSLDRYRRAMRWYPAAWRRSQGDAAIGAYLDRDEATGTNGPSGRDRFDLARAGVVETFAALLRPSRLVTTTVGLVLLIGAAWLGSVTLGVGGRVMTIVTTGVMDTVGRSHENPVLITAGLLALAWLLTAIVAFHRGSRLCSLVIALGGAVSAGTMDQLAWSGLVASVAGQTPPAAFALLSAVALAASLAAVIAAVRAGLLEPIAQWLIGAASATQVAGAWLLLSLDQPTSVREAFVLIGSALALPMYLAVTGGSIALLSVGDHRWSGSDATGASRAAPVKTATAGSVAT